MRKIMPALSVLLAVALVFASMPAARAQEITLQAAGAVMQDVTADEDASVLMAKVTETYGVVITDWEDLGGVLNMFTAFTRLRPGVAGAYYFTLHNLYTKPIQYWFSAKGYLDGALSGELSANPLTDAVTDEAGLFAFRLTDGGLSGTVPAGESVDFTLEWVWDYYLNNTRDGVDTNWGIESRERDGDLEYEAVLHFYIEADNSNPQFPWWMLGVAALIGGGVVLGGLTLPWWLALPAVPVLLLLGWRLCGNRLCRPEKEAKDIVSPPKTGDDWTMALSAGAGMAMASLAMAALLRRRKKEALEGGGV